MENLFIEFIKKKIQQSDYDWANISFNNERVGKARCSIDDTVLIVYSINIFPEYAGHGYGKEFVDYSKLHFNTIVADRVRYTAIGFWERCGFVDNNDGNWIWTK